MLFWQRPDVPAKPSQLLQVVHSDTLYCVGILHAGGRIRHAGDVRPSQFLRQHTHDIYHVCLFLDGDSTFMLNNRTEKCRSGTLVLCGPQEPHEFYYCAKDYLSYVEVAISLESAEGKPSLQVPFHELLRFYAGENLAPVRFPVQLGPKQTKLLCGLLESLTEHLVTGRTSRFELAKHLFRIIEFLIDEVYTISGSAASPEILSLMKAREDIERMFNQDLSLSEIAAEANLSAGYFGRAFRARFGTTPMAYQRQLRIRAAKNMLTSTSFMCKEIAAQVGFKDVYLFSRTFKNMVGLSPTEFRKTRAFRFADNAD